MRASGPALDHFLDRAIAAPSPPPGQAFDNLYYIATSWVSAWALKTSDGIILIDALNNTREAQELIEGGMVKLGLDPAQIKFVVITHAHGDHYGGANYFVQKYKARVIASEADWAQMDGGVLEFPYKDWMSPPKRDRVVKDGETLTLGDTTMTFYVTPGHTLGTVSPVFNVTSGGRPHTVMLWGGTAFNFGKDVPRLETYIAATDRMAGLARTLPVDVLISNHPGYDGSLAKAKLRCGARRARAQSVRDRAGGGGAGAAGDGHLRQGAAGSFPDDVAALAVGRWGRAPGPGEPEDLRP